MLMQPVISSNVALVGYSSATATLSVQYKNAAGTPGAVYHYHGIKPEQHAALMRADSIGKHINSHIRPFASKIEKHGF